MENSKRWLVLENGKIFQGTAFGAEGEVSAEVVFSTSMTGYCEALTDKGFYGQIVVQTFPQIGNYGIISEDFESDSIGLKGYIVKDWCQEPSNFRSEGELDTFLKQRNVVGIKGIDTRSLTKTIRDNGTMNAAITSDPTSVDLDKLKECKVFDAVKNVSAKEKYTLGDPNAKIKIALIDYGTKKSIAEELIKRGAFVTVLPYDVKAAEIKDLNPDGIMLSSGPGEPHDIPEAVANLKEISEQKIPTMGICLGHLMLASAMGFEVEAMKYGHRGENQPVKDMNGGKLYVTAQGHGYMVKSSSIDEKKAKELFVNVNDKTNEGIEYKSIPAITVQFHPEAAGGPLDTLWVFDEFFKLMGGKN